MKKINFSWLKKIKKWQIAIIALLVIALVAFIVVKSNKKPQKTFNIVAADTKVEKRDIKVMLSTEADTALMDQLCPTDIIVASGSTHRVLGVPGVENAKYATAAYFEPETIGNKVVLIGGGMINCEIAVSLADEGKDVTIISYSKSVLMALDAAKVLEAKGIDAEVLDLRSLVPLDFDAITESVRKTGRVIITHEACERTGFGAEVAAQIADKLFVELDAPILRVCGANIPVPNATLPEIESAPTVERLVNAAVRICQGGKRNG